MPDQEVLEALWREHVISPTEETLERLVLAYVPLARYLAQRALAKAPPHQDREDILSYAHHGLLDAIKRFDPDRGFKFETYATRRIAGAIIDGQRRQDPLSRSLRKRVKEMARSVAELGDELEREPTLGEVADRMAVSIDEVRQLQLAQKSLNSSLNVLMDPDRGGDGLLEQVSSGATHDDGHELELRMIEIGDALAPLLSRLSPRERAFVVYHYCERKTLREVAKCLGLHETRTGQLRTEIMKALTAA